VAEIDAQAAAVILAAGDGSRLKSRMPKVLHPAAGRPLLCHVLAALEPLPVDRRVVVGSNRWEELRATVDEAGFSDGISYAVQESPQGTGHAVRIGMDVLGSARGVVFVLFGDTPLIETDTLYRMLDAHRAAGAGATILTSVVVDASGYGRVVRGPSGAVERIVEERDATETERRIQEINGGVYVFDAALLTEMLAKVDRENAQGEYYLTDVIRLLRLQDAPVAAVRTVAEELSGVNNRSQLAYVSGLIRHRVCERWMAEGVSIVDPRTTYIDSTVSIQQDATIHPFTFLEGNTHVAEGAEVGPQTRVVDSQIGAGATVTFAVVRSSEIGPEALVGPFASLRPGVKLARGAKLGTFVESKNSTIGEGSKAPHLSYLGDAEVGKGVNVGAGTITCNWDGREKHRTVIEDDAYISSDTMLVAPTRVGRRAATGAGAVVRGDVPDDALAVGVPARILEGRGDLMGRGGTSPAGDPEEEEDD
jgi:bifunctional UDP-N-acetylglucosamine pyrophosphorylase/glucosamine-1-phosphate N-acetyltransferase